MKKKRVFQWLVVSAMSLVFLLFNCSDPLVDMAYESRSALDYPLEVDPVEIGDTDSSLSVTLLAGRKTPVGTVDLWINEENLIVEFNSTWLLTETHFDVVSHPADFPQTRKGNPKPGHFSYQANHVPGVNSYTYEIPLEDFAEGETLYFAAHAEVELRDDGTLVESESAWAEGFDFPGANWSMYFAGKLPSPVDLTGFWDIYFYPDGMDGFGPLTFYMEQIGSELYALYGITGSIVGSEFYMEAFDVDMGGFVIDIFLNGTLEGNEITGELSGGMGSGTFKLITPSSALFGHLDMTGQIDSFEIELDTDYALGTTDDTMATHDVSFGIFDGVNHFGFGLWLPDLSPGYKTVVTNDIEESDQVVLLLHHDYNEFMADSGYIIIGSIDDSHIILEDFEFYFPDGGSIKGNAILNFDESSGIITVDWGELYGFVLLPSVHTNVYSYYHSNTWTSFFLGYEDNHLSTMLFLGISGEPLPGIYYSPYDFSVSFRWQYDEVGIEDLLLEANGSLTIDSFVDDVLVGSLNMEAPYNLSGNFNIPITISDDPF